MLLYCINFCYDVWFTGGVEYVVLLYKLVLCSMVYWWSRLCCFIV